MFALEMLAIRQLGLFQVESVVLIGQSRMAQSECGVAQFAEVLTVSANGVEKNAKEAQGNTVS